jgi:hypothetical protein
VTGKGSAISNASKLGIDFSIGRPRLWSPREVMATLAPTMHIKPSGQRYVLNGLKRINRKHSGRVGSYDEHESIYFLALVINLTTRNMEVGNANSR